LAHRIISPLPVATGFGQGRHLTAPALRVHANPPHGLICPTAAAWKYVSSLARKNIPVYRNSDLA